MNKKERNEIEKLARQAFAGDEMAKIALMTLMAKPDRPRRSSK